MRFRESPDFAVGALLHPGLPKVSTRTHGLTGPPVHERNSILMTMAPAFHAPHSCSA